MLSFGCHGLVIFCSVSSRIYQFFFYNILLLKVWLLFLCYFRFHVVYSYIKEEDVQVSIWPVCMDTHDSYCGVHAVLIYCRQYL